ncbi:hypothetical protein NC653_012008 [Populus alba x Populus x berolinensis]|uniref:F-box domain-containing protein n=1 Tax=Populus alba x Populus x berolinensis TaxID=444605 RepID=A0AAD6W7A3_9ROSI|nr:hypothetical protein NC653_012008 [Populus alba x Populus x berolinensis]
MVALSTPPPQQPSSTTTQDGTISTLHPDILQTHILTLLDGPTLAATACASSELYALSTEDKLWRNICTSSWPSINDPTVSSIISTFSSGHRSFFSDSYPLLHHHHHSSSFLTTSTEYLVSSVDIYYKDVPIFLKKLKRMRLLILIGSSALLQGRLARAQRMGGQCQLARGNWLTGRSGGEEGGGYGGEERISMGMEDMEGRNIDREGEFGQFFKEADGREGRGGGKGNVGRKAKGKRTFASPSAVVRVEQWAHFHPILSQILHPRKSCLSSGFVKSPVTARNPLGLAGTGGGKFMWVASTVKHTGNWWQEPDWALLREHRD